MENENKEKAEEFAKEYNEKLKPFGFEIYKEPVMTGDGFLILEFNNKEKNLLLEIIVDVESGEFLASIYDLSTLEYKNGIGFGSSEDELFNLLKTL